jgi:hypothetical protein
MLLELRDGLLILGEVSVHLLRRTLLAASPDRTIKRWAVATDR